MSKCFLESETNKKHNCEFTPHLLIHGKYDTMSGLTLCKVKLIFGREKTEFAIGEGFNSHYCFFASSGLEKQCAH